MFQCFAGFKGWKGDTAGPATEVVVVVGGGGFWRLAKVRVAYSSSKGKDTAKNIAPLDIYTRLHDEGARRPSLASNGVEHNEAQTEIVARKRHDTLARRQLVNVILNNLLSHQYRKRGKKKNFSF